MPETLPPPGDQVARLLRRMDEQDRKIATLETALRAKYTTIDGPPGLDVKNGGSVNVKDGGDIAVSGGGDVRVTDGGSVDVQDGGRFRVRHPDSLGGDDAVYAGDIHDGVTDAYQGTGLLVEHPDGTDILGARTTADGGSIVYVKDRHGWGAVETDPIRGGLALPWIPFAMAPAQVLSWQNTTSASFVTLLSGRVRRVSPRAGVSISGSCGGGSSGELRLLRDGVQVGDVLTIATGSAASAYIVFDLLDPLQGATSNIELQARVTGGAGPVYVTVNWAEGRS